MRRILDGLYSGALVAACLAMVAIAVLVFAQILGRLLDRVLMLAGVTPLGLTVPSLSDFGGFLFVAAASLALPATLRAGGHIRVTLVLSLGGARFGRIMAGVALLAAVGLGAFAAYHSGLQAWDSWKFNSVSFGMVRVALWIPQGVMTLGFALLLLAILDELVALLRGQTPAFQQADDAKSAGGH
jgi:TRAP-type C4-dicarboxylate transport system permease small subunit